jgi:hypothetical protein
LLNAINFNKPIPNQRAFDSNLQRNLPRKQIQVWTQKLENPNKKVKSIKQQSFREHKQSNKDDKLLKGKQDWEKNIPGTF